MLRYNIALLILLILSIINIALAAPVLTPEDVVVHVPKDVITVLGKRGDELKETLKLSESFDRWWGGNQGSSSSVIRPLSSSAPLESGHGSMQVHAPPTDPVSSTEPGRDPEPSESHLPTPSPASDSSSAYGSMPSLESVSDLDLEVMGVDRGVPPPNPESLTESGHSHTPVAPAVEYHGKSSNAPATSASDGTLRRGVGMTGLSDYPQSQKQSASRGSANPMDEDF